MGIKAERVIEPLERMRTLILDWPEEPSPKHVHDLRTTARRLQSLAKLAGLEHNGHAPKLWRAVRSVRKAASKARDLDVFAELLLSLRSSRNDASKQRLIKHIQSLRPEALGALDHTVSKYQKRIRRGLTLERIQTLKSVSGVRAEMGEVDACCEKAVRKQASRLASTGKVEESNAHEFRVRVKRLRDMLGFCDNASQETLAKLGELKDLLGEWHDWQELQLLAKDALQSPADQRFVHALQRVTKIKLTRALRFANQLSRFMRKEKFFASQEQKAKDRMDKGISRKKRADNKDGPLFKVAAPAT